MNAFSPLAFLGSSVPVPLGPCSSCCDVLFQPCLASSVVSYRGGFRAPGGFGDCRLVSSRSRFRRRGKFSCRVTTETEPESNEDNDGVDKLPPEDSPGERFDSQPIVMSKAINGGAESRAQDVEQASEEIEIASGSHLPGLKSQRLDESMRIPKDTIEVLKDQVFGFDTFYVTAHEPYEGGVLFKGNLRGQPAKSYEKIATRMQIQAIMLTVLLRVFYMFPQTSFLIQNKFGEQYKLFLLVNPEDDKPVAVVVPRTTLQPETTAVPEWFAAGAFGLVSVFTLLLRNVPALQSNLLSIFDNLELLKDGVPGALVTALILGVHELGHILVAKDAGIKLGVPYFVPSWQIGSFGTITRIINIVPKREDLLKVALAGPAASFSLGFLILLVGFILPPADGLGIVVDASVFHESFLVGGLAKLLLGDVLKEGTPLSVNPLVIWAWAGLLINAINSIPAGELDGGRISLAIWGRKASARLTGISIMLLALSSFVNEVAFYWVVLIFFLQRGPIAPLSEEITGPDQKYIALGIVVLSLSVLVSLPYPLPFSDESITSLL